MTDQSDMARLFVCLFMGSGQLINEFFPDCFKVMFFASCFMPEGGSLIYKIGSLFVAVGLNILFVVLPHWDNMSNSRSNCVTVSKLVAHSLASVRRNSLRVEMHPQALVVSFHSLYGPILESKGRGILISLYNRDGPCRHLVLSKGLVINYGEGGATKWENRGSVTFCATPSRHGKTFRAPPFKEWKLYAPPLQYG